MGKKYIIEMEDMMFHKTGESGSESYLWRVKGFNSLVFDRTGISKLTPYTEPDLEQVKKEAYDKGYVKSHMETRGSYQQGLNDMWEAVRKIIDMDADTSEKVFGEWYTKEVVRAHTASEAIEKLKAYERKHEGINVGDEVTDDKGDTGVCTEISYPANSMHIMYADGTATDISLTGVTKTGRHFDEIAAVLEKMREGQEQ